MHAHLPACVFDAGLRCRGAVMSVFDGVCACCFGCLTLK